MAELEPTTKKVKIERNDNYQDSREGVYTAILIVEGKRLYILKEVGMNMACNRRKHTRPIHWPLFVLYTKRGQCIGLLTY